MYCSSLFSNIAACVQAGLDFFKAVEMEKAKQFPMLYKPKKKDGLQQTDDAIEERTEPANEELDDGECSLVSD